MTEAEWASSRDPERMLAFLYSLPAYAPGHASSRKLRLFACAAVRRAWNTLTDGRGRTAVEVAELFADGQATRRQLIDVREEAGRAASAVPEAARPVLRAAQKAAGWDATFTAEDAATEVRRVGGHAAAREQCDLLREIFGHPPLGPPTRLALTLLTWNDGIVVKLAQAAYEERLLPEGRLDPSRLGVLADALEEAGCTDPDILGHLRGPDPHVRGCWALDALLGKS
jgi:hypothetical protein